MPEEMQRRDLLKKGLALSAGVAAFASFEERNLLAAMSDKAKGSAPASPMAADSGGDMPMGKLGKLNVSRIIVGGNLTSGNAHARDLIYVSPLVKSYFTDEKIFETWQICEECGINTAILRLDDNVIRLTNKYWNERGGKFQWIVQIKPKDEKGLETDIKRGADNGATGAYLQGQVGDNYAEEGRVDLLMRAVELMRENYQTVGVGGHTIAPMKVCEKEGVKPDFFMKTINSADYWSAKPQEKNNNIWCEDTEETIAFMKTVKKPWVGFKVMGAGAIHPRQAFPFAVKSGADFMCLGMFDFQVREDVIIGKNALADNQKRERPWFG